MIKEADWLYNPWNFKSDANGVWQAHRLSKYLWPCLIFHQGPWIFAFYRCLSVFLYNFFLSWETLTLTMGFFIWQQNAWWRCSSCSLVTRSQETPTNFKGANWQLRVVRQTPSVPQSKAPDLRGGELTKNKRVPLALLDVFGAVHIVDEVRLAHKGMLVIDWLLGISNPWIRLNKVRIKSKFVRICISFAQRGRAVLRHF